jgi:hypothetical protein
MTQPVPADRVIKNVSKYVAAHPRDARAHYTLGRIHSLAFVAQASDVDLMVTDRNGNPNALPGFPPYASAQVKPTDPNKKPTVAQKRHLEASIREYAKATELAPKDALYWLGLGWMREQAARVAGELDPPKADQMPRIYGEQSTRALAAYQKALDLAREPDSKKQSLSANSDDDAVSVEAGEGIIRLGGSEAWTDVAKRNNWIRTHIAEIKKKPQWITPILVGRPGQSLSDLLSARGRSQFDLAGTREGRVWPWVKPDTGILVWDPMRTGRIANGFQLFGSRTSQMFWKNGYEPLAALDDNRDGWLRGTELAGISIWRDANGNGVSDSGEVRTVEFERIMAIAVRPTSRAHGTPEAGQGVLRSDGSFAPSFDWTPQSVSSRRMR